MKNLITVIGLLVAIVVFTLSCEKDDICSETTPTTPKLILRFYDVGNTDETQAVPNLLAFGLDDNNEIVSFLGVILGTTDSLAIPLRTDSDQTKIILHQDYDIDDNGTPEPEDDIVLGNPDMITINYMREDVYVSRACGFKTVFNGLIFNVTPDADNWIINSEVILSNVENENSAHVKVYH